MSGIAGIVSLDGAPVDPAALERMRGQLAARGPDGTASRVAGAAGMAFSLLRTGDRGEGSVEQPLTLDGRHWIVADARIDARAQLVAELRAGGIETSAERPAAELILHAVRLWDTGAAEHLRGDFAFAVWDAETRRLLCARDHFGFKPFYFARTANAFVFSNSLDCVADHPGVDRSADEGWIADFLLHGDAQSADATVYAGVRQLPAAHLMVVRPEGTSQRRYWSIPEQPPEVRRGDPEQHAEHFLELLREAVADRLPLDHAALLLSGGRDSTALAAVWRDLVDRGVRDTALRGHTAYHARLLPDAEPRFAGLAAAALRLPHQLLAVDDYGPFERWGTPELRRPQPAASPLLAIEAELYGAAAGHARVLLTGQGGDALLRETSSRLTRLVLEGKLPGAAREAAQYLRWHRRIPRPGVRSWLRSRGGYDDTPPAVPAWLDEDFAARVDLAGRIALWRDARRTAHPHALRPEAVRQLNGSLWPILGGVWDPGSTGLPLEVRHPFFDLRLVDFVLSIPPAQWYNDKGLLRLAMRGRLPRPVLARPKTPVSGDPLSARLRPGWLRGLTVGRAVRSWVDVRRLPRLTGGLAELPPTNLSTDLHPLALSLWLTDAHSMNPSP